jgi:hypothetical protein
VYTSILGKEKPPETFKQTRWVNVCLVFEEVKRERVSAHVHTNEDANVGVNKKKIN